jgi:DNA polymerase-1
VVPQPQIPLLLHDDVSAWRPPAPPDLSRFDAVELDCETTGLSWVRGDRPVGIAVRTPERSYYLPFAHRGGQNLDEATVKRWAERELRGKRVSNINTRFDVHMLRAWGVDLRDQGCTFHDVAHSAALLDDHRRRFALDVLALEELGEGKLDAGPGAHLWEMPAGAVAAYAERDVELVARLAAVYDPQLRAQSLERVQALEDAVIPVVVEMEANGMPLDLDLLDTWVTESQRIYEQIAWEIERSVGFLVNPDKTSDLMRLFKATGATWGVTETGKPSFTQDVMARERSKHPAIELVWRLGKLADLRSKYLLKYQRDQVDGVLYPSLNQLMTNEGGTISGRFSCVRPNVQQVLGKDKHRRLYGWLTEYGPHNFLVKRLFLPREGVWCSADMAQAEFRIFSSYSASARLLDIYRKNPHANFHKEVGKIVATQRPDVDHTRVKAVNFTNLYGGGPGSVAHTLGISREEAEEVCAAYHAAFPEASTLLNRASRVANDRGYVMTLYGRRARFKGPRWRRERVHKALNAVIQGSAADANKQILVNLYKARHELGVTLRQTIHDSVEADLTGDVPAYQAFLNQAHVELKVPLLWDVKTSPRSWGDVQ